MFAFGIGGVQVVTILSGDLLNFQQLVVLFAVLWFMCELIWVPEQVFGKVVRGQSLIHILRKPWLLSMSLLALIMVGTEDSRSSIVHTDLVFYARVVLLSIAFCVASWQVYENKPTPNFFRTINSTQVGWMTARWYERRPPNRQRRLTIRGVDLYPSYFIGLLLLVNPIISTIIEAKEITRSTSIDRDSVLRVVPVFLLDVVLVFEAIVYIAEPMKRPVHLSTLLLNTYVSIMGYNIVGAASILSLIAPCVAWGSIEVVYGSSSTTIPFSDYAQAIGNIVWDAKNGTPQFRTLYRFCYVVAIWTGVFAAVAWTVGWCNDWISFDIENGTIVQSILDLFWGIEKAVIAFIESVWAILNHLTLCGAKQIDSTLAKSRNHRDDIVKVEKLLYTANNITVALTANGAGNPLFDFLSKISDKKVTCCVCSPLEGGMNASCADTYDTPDGTHKDAFQHAGCPNSESDSFLGKVLTGNANLSTMPDTPTCVISTYDTGKKPADERTATDETRADADGLVTATEAHKTAMGEWNASSNGRTELAVCHTGNCSCTGKCASSPDHWVDAGAQVAVLDDTCRDIACYTFVAAMLAAAASAFIPFVGGGISFGVRNAAKFVYTMFKKVENFFGALYRANKKHKYFRKIRQLLAKALDVVKSGEEKYLGTKEDLIYSFFPLFILSLVSIFAGFWQRDSAQEARNSLAGVMLGLLVANVAACVVALFIPLALKTIMGVLPKQLIQITVVVHRGWHWMQYATYASVTSSVFWVLALLLGDEEDDASLTQNDNSSAGFELNLVGVKPQQTTTLALSSLNSNRVSTLRHRVSRSPSPRAPPRSTFALFNGEVRTTNVASWLSNCLWLIPVFVLFSMALVDGTPVFRVTGTAFPDVLHAIANMMGLEGFQEHFITFRDGADMNLCDLVGKLVKMAWEVAEKLIGQAIEEALDTVLSWFKRAFFDLREVLTILRDIPELVIDILRSQVPLLVLFACPMTACLCNLIGLLLTVTRTVDGKRLELLHSFQYLLGITGLSLSLSLTGFMGVIEGVKLPIINTKIHATAMLTQSVLCNGLVLVAYASHRFDRAVPLRSAPYGHRPA